MDIKLVMAIECIWIANVYRIGVRDGFLNEYGETIRDLMLAGF